MVASAAAQEGLAGTGSVKMQQRGDELWCAPYGNACVLPMPTPAARSLVELCPPGWETVIRLDAASYTYACAREVRPVVSFKEQR